MKPDTGFAEMVNNEQKSRLGRKKIKLYLDVKFEMPIRHLNKDII